MEHLVASLPSMARVDSRLDEYLTLLDRVIEDRVLTEAEATLLLTQAREAGLSQELVQEAHSQYMRDLLRAALADGTITERENQDLRKVNGLLAIPESQFETLVRGAIAEHVVGLEDGRLKAEPKQACSGLTVCFTGTLMGRIGCQPISRQQAEQLAAERGMIIKRGVSRDLDLLVAADPKSMSGKANKARHLGIRIVAEQAFWRMLGISVD